MIEILHTLTISIPSTIPRETVVAIMGGDFKDKSHEIEVITEISLNAGCKGSFHDPPEPDSLEAITCVENIAWEGVKIVLGGIDPKLKDVDTFNAIFNAVVEAENVWRKTRMESEVLEIMR